MNKKRKSPPQLALGTGSENTTEKAKTTKPQHKIKRVLKAFAGGRSLNRFEAERDRTIADHCLHSTVSEIQKHYDISVARETETISGYCGEPTRVCRYWLGPEEIERARQMLGMARKEVAA